jgi:hypothetical protein
LDKNVRHFVQKAPTEGGPRVVIRVTARRDVAEGYRVVGRSLDSAIGENAGGVAIIQQRQELRGVLGRAASSCAGLLQTTYIQSIDHFDDEPRQMIFREPVFYRGGHR